MIKTTHAFIITLLVLTGGFMWATFFPGAPFVAFSGTVGLVFAGYSGKRLMQKKKEFNNVQED